MAEYIICRVHVSVSQIISFTLPHGFCLIYVGVLFCFVSHLGDLAFDSKSYNIHHLLTWDFSNLIHFNTASRDSEGSAFIRTVRSELEILEIWKCLFILHKMDGVSLQNPTMQSLIREQEFFGAHTFCLQGDYRLPVQQNIYKIQCDTFHRQVFISVFNPFQIRLYSSTRYKPPNSVWGSS